MGMGMGDGVRTPRGRYACGCRLELAHGAHGGVRVVPACARHGEGFALRTVFARAVGRTLGGVVKRGIIGRNGPAAMSSARLPSLSPVAPARMLGPVLGDVQP
jgi:hypothetical protein